MYNKLCLEVMIPVRERIHITQKCIESIHDNSKIFNNINISVFDNNSILENNSRLSIFQNLLSQGKIKYYSYDTDVSSHNCFGKAVAFKRWIQYMKTDDELRKLKQIHPPEKNYYMLVDNDFIMGPRWDEFFISTVDQIQKYEKETRFIVQSPGGVVQSHRDNGNTITLTNLFTRESFDTLSCSGGGSSGLWFMNYDMLSKLEWEVQYLAHTYKQNKRHDSTTWIKIKNEIPANSNYVTGIIVPDYLSPFALHMSSSEFCTSICNKLTNRTFDQEYTSILDMDEKIKDLSHQELYEIHKDIGGRW